MKTPSRACAKTSILLATKMEIYLDWASDPRPRPGKPMLASVDPLSSSSLGAYISTSIARCRRLHAEFRRRARIVQAASLKTRHETACSISTGTAPCTILTIEYCLDVTLRIGMSVVLQWASQQYAGRSSGHLTFSTEDTDFFARSIWTRQLLRLNAFMALAMYDIEKIRVKYRPNGLPVQRAGRARCHRCGRSHCSPMQNRPS